MPTCWIVFTVAPRFEDFLRWLHDANRFCIRVRKMISLLLISSVVVYLLNYRYLIRRQAPWKSRTYNAPPTESATNAENGEERKYFKRNSRERFAKTRRSYVVAKLTMTRCSYFKVTKLNVNYKRSRGVFPATDALHLDSTGFTATRSTTAASLAPTAGQVEIRNWRTRDCVHTRPSANRAVRSGISSTVEHRIYLFSRRLPLSTVYLICLIA